MVFGAMLISFTYLLKSEFLIFELLRFI